MPPKSRSDESSSKSKPTLDPRFIISIEGREFVKYPGLLDLGHSMGIGSLEVESVQLPCSDNGNLAVCKATLTSPEGQVFSDLGDASEANTSARVSKHLVRMASTRALARVLRTYTNIGITADIEMEDADFSGQSRGQTQPRKYTPRKSRENQPVVQPASLPKTGNPNPAPPRVGNGTSPPMSDSQRRAVFAISRRQSISEEQVNALATEMFNHEFDHLTVGEASSLIQHLQSQQAAAA